MPLRCSSGRSDIRPVADATGYILSLLCSFLNPYVEDIKGELTQNICKKLQYEQVSQGASLKELTEAQLKDAMLQVVNLAETFGSTYSSTDLYFPGGSDKEEKSKEVKPAQGRRP